MLEATSLAYLVIRPNSKCVEVVSVFKPTAGISLSDGKFYFEYGACLAEAGRAGLK